MEFRAYRVSIIENPKNRESISIIENPKNKRVGALPPTL